MTRFPNLSRKKMLALATACMMSAVPAFAQDDMEDLDLGELFELDMEVTVASKKAEKLSDAPGIIVAYSDADMKKLNYYTIRDLANITTGYSTVGMIGEQTLTTRGQRVGEQYGSFDNNKHLLMVDGIPVRHLRAGKVPVEEEMSLYGMKRVEFLKGPGSALYGTGAFLGVINVVPKNLTENGVESEGQVTFGTNSLTKQAMGYVVAKNDNGQVRVNASIFDKEASADTLRLREYDPKTSENNTVVDDNGDYRNWDDRNAVSLNMNYTHKSGAGVGFIYSRKNGGLGEYWWGTTNQFTELQWETMIPYVKYQTDFTDVLSFNSYALANQSIEKCFYPADPSVQYTRKFGDMELLTEVAADLEEIGTIIGGVNYDMKLRLGNDGISSGSFNVSSDKTGEVDFTTSDPFHTISFYLQYQKEFPLLSGLKLTAGFREDIGRSEFFEYSQFSPRVGVVQKLTDNIGLKLLYGTALRAPSMKEVGIGDEAKIDMVKQGDSNFGDIPSVDAEVIQSFEGGLNASFKQVSANVAGFYNTTTDAIGRTSINGNNSDVAQQVPANVDGETVSYGVEADVSVMPVPSMKVLLGFDMAKAWVKNDGEANDSTQSFGVPTGKLSGGVMYAPKTKVPFSISPVFSYVMGYTEGGKIADEKVIKENDDPFYTVDVNMTVDPFENFGFGVQLKNLTNNGTYQPGITIAEGGTHHLDIKKAGFNANFSVYYKF